MSDGQPLTVEEYVELAHMAGLMILCEIVDPERV